MAICDSDAEDRAALGEILHLFQNLAKGAHELTSRPSHNYNCVAFALGEEDCRLWPTHGSGGVIDWNYWPRRIPRELTVAAFKMLFESRGYFVCAHSNWEDSFEKIALYCDANGRPTHAARQITRGPHCGQWQSKIGMRADIRHETLAALEGAEYGKVFGCFARELSS